MYTRLFTPPKKSFFLFGPRGTGKTTWLRQHFNDALWIDLLKPQIYLEHQRDPALLEKTVHGSKAKNIVIDEIQKLPSMLDSVHSLMEEHQNQIRFIMTGSSARKLKRTSANLLAGRAIRKDFFPLVYSEYENDFSIESAIEFGNLPGVVTLTDKREKIETLETYAYTYINEEIKTEANIKNLESFGRFLQIAALMNGQPLNITNIARESGVERTTVHGYFQALVDTLIGFYLPAWRPRLKIKESGHSKFYFFDPGIVRSLTGHLRDKPESTERGGLFETLVLHEMRSWMAYHSVGGELFHWRTPSESEIDLIWQRGPKSVGIEIKCTDRWRSEFGYTLKEFHDKNKLKKVFGVYTGVKKLKDGPITILPFQEFANLLKTGDLFE